VDIFEQILWNMLNCNKTCYSYVAMYTCIIQVNIIQIRKIKIMLRKIMLQKYIPTILKGLLLPTNSYFLQTKW